jgi:integration host factor subunit alpha
MRSFFNGGFKQMTLTKADITGQLCDHLPASSRAEAAEYVDVIFAVLKETLGQGENLKRTGFRSFMVVNKRERNGRDPQTDAPLVVTARRIVRFKPSAVYLDMK